MTLQAIFLDFSLGDDPYSRTRFKGVTGVLLLNVDKGVLALCRFELTISGGKNQFRFS